MFINWNDSFYIPHLAKHYNFCDKIIMFDNYSDDDSVKIAKYLGIEVQEFGIKGQLNDQHYLNIKNHEWKKYRDQYDYVIVVDADEFVFIDDLKGTLPKVTGYNMVSNDLPQNDIFEINTGYYDVNYSKQAIFSTKLQEINYVHGCHVCHPVGNKDNSGSARLYHFRDIGGFNRLWKRHEHYMKRMSDVNKRFKWGIHYTSDKETKERDFNIRLSKCEKLNFK